VRRITALLLSLSLIILPALAAFPDVAPGSWYDLPVTEMAEAGWIKGLPDGSFHPERVISAGEFIAITARWAGLAEIPSGSPHWAAGHVLAALQAGWYDWDELPPDNEAGWDAPITRQLAVKIVMKALLPTAVGDYATWSGKIRDFSSITGRYYDVTFAAYAAGIITGDQAGNFRPDASLTRAEACAIIYRAGKASEGSLPPVSSNQPSPPPSAAVEPLSGGVSSHGWLHVEGTQLQDEAGEAVVLRGMSTHGLQWYGQFASYESIRSTAEYGANVFRVAMYTGEGGYLSDPSLASDAFAAVDAAIQNDMYVILDWHILSDGNPRTNQDKAAEFFTAAAQRYRDTPNVLYEICNEPNGGVTWSGDVKPYTQTVIAAIRGQSPKAVVLVGSPTWSQDLHLAAADPLDEENILYTCHFYAGTHGQFLRDRIDQALAAGLPVFVTEWGTSRADGSGGVFLEEAGTWLDFLDSRGISWCCWSLCDKDETSAALKPGASPTGPWSEEDLTPSGAFVFRRFKNQPSGGNHEI